MSRPKTADIIDPRAIAADFFRKLGGMEGMTKWGKTHRSLAYQLISKLLAQPIVVNNNTNNHVSIEAAGEAARLKIENEFIRLMEAQRASVGDPAAYHGGDRVVDHHLTIEHQPQLSDDAAVSPLNESSKSWQKGPLLKPGGVATRPAETTHTGGQNKISKYSNLTVPGLAAGAALDGLDNSLSTTQRFLNWKGHGGPP
jgi:hypothetical protein